MQAERQLEGIHMLSAAVGLNFPDKFAREPQTFFIRGKEPEVDLPRRLQPLLIGVVEDDLKLLESAQCSQALEQLVLRRPHRIVAVHTSGAVDQVNEAAADVDDSEERGRAPRPATTASRSRVGGTSFAIGRSGFGTRLIQAAAFGPLAGTEDWQSGDWIRNDRSRDHRRTELWTDERWEDVRRRVRQGRRRRNRINGRIAFDRGNQLGFARGRLGEAVAASVSVRAVA